MAEPTPTAALGTVGGHYKLLSKLGEGAFGEVYRAQHELLEQEFAVKLLRQELCEDQQVRDRFLDEARALIRFNHGNVVQLRHVGEHEGRLFLVMDFVKGEALNDVLRVEGPFSEARAVALIDQVLQGLAAAHAVGIVHRDLKPSNLLVEKRPDGTEKLHILDFGLSKLGAAGDGMKSAHRSVSGSIIGTLAYMSPEQIQGHTVDQRSDVFAAGLVLMEMLQGHHPYPGESGIMVAARLLRDPIPPLDAKVAAKVSPMVRAAISTALERDRDARFSSATAFAHALQGKGPPSDTSRVTTIEQARQDLARADARRALEQASGQIDRKKKGGLVALLLLLAAGGAAGWYFLMGPGKGSASGPGGPGGGTTAAQAPTRTPGIPSAAPTAPQTPPQPTSPQPTPPPPVRPEVPDPAPAAPPRPPEPTATVPTPAAPAPTVPAPKEPEPAPPTPPAPTPPPAPKEPDPVVVAPPTPKEPEPAPKAPDPAPTPTAPPEPPVTPPTPPAPTPRTAAEALKTGHEALAAGKWAEAKTAYREALEKDVSQIPALRGASAAALTEADALARSGHLPEAQQAFTETIEWLGARYTVYEKERDTPEATLNRLRGFARLYRAQAHSERLRWHLVAGEGGAAGTERKAAEDDFELAWQFLQRDSVPYWEFLIRRGEHRFLVGSVKEAIDDFAITTQTNNTSVPAHMWLAHARGVRRLIELAVAKNDPRLATGWAAKAIEIVKNGEAWKGTEFPQDQWLEWVRVVWLSTTLQATGAELNPQQSLLRFYVGEAAKCAPAPYQPADLTRSKALAAQAALDTALARFARLSKKDAEATPRAAAAEKGAREAIALAEAVAQAGGPLPGPFPYRILADALRLLGKTDEAAQAEKSASGAALRNPD